MRVCSLCGDTYRDHVDFCFGDGELLRPLSEEEIAARIASEEPPTDPLSRPLDAPGTYTLPAQVLPEIPEIPAHTAPAAILDPSTEALVKRVQAIVRASVAAVERREQRKRQVEAWRRLLSRFGIALSS